LDRFIAVRTMVWLGGGSYGGGAGGTYDLKVGAGVVADSVPALEWEETMSKARALLKAVEIAGRGF
jgi:anthranilate synthase component 1